MITPQAAKAKGRRLQNEVVALVMENFSDVLEDGDIRGAIMGESGTDVKLSPIARRKFPFSMECKNQERGSIWAWWKQTLDNLREDTYPLLIFRKNRRKHLCCILRNDLNELLDEYSEFDSVEDPEFFYRTREKKTVNIWNEWDQTRDESGHKIPLFMFKKPDEDDYRVTMSFRDFLDILYG